jgi:hypothetical protein
METLMESDDLWPTLAFIFGGCLFLLNPVGFTAIAAIVFGVYKLNAYMTRRRDKKIADAIAAEKREWEENAIPVGESALAEQP